MYLYVKVPEVNYNQCEDEFIQWKVLDSKCHPCNYYHLKMGKMGISYAKVPFIMGLFYTRRCHSKWVHFRISHICVWVFLYWSRPPPPTPPPTRPGLSGGQLISLHPAPH